MGERKVLLPVAGASLLARALAATAAYPRIVVASADVAAGLSPGPSLVVIVNDEPERGMTHSLRLADAAADPAAALAVVLADTPFVDADLVARVFEALGTADVAYPVRAGVPGHPVVFGPRPRRELAGLIDGDTLRTLRADPRWTRVELEIPDDRPFIDIDTPTDLARARKLAEVQTSATGDAS